MGRPASPHSASPLHGVRARALLLLVLAACSVSLSPLAEGGALTALSGSRSFAPAGKSHLGYCGLCRDHTMCLYYGPRQGCSSRPLSRAEREEVLAAHNTVRSLLATGNETRGAPGPQPPAADMRFMRYDEELAAIAQRWADQCQFKHDACRHVERFRVGQNIYLEKTTGPQKRPDWNVVTRKWFDEVAMHNGQQTPGSYRFLFETGHFTQVGWADTFLMGCGATESVENHSGRRWNSRIYVCNYGPSGNVVGRSMYQPGPPCSRCAPGAQCYYGLCY